VVITRGGHSHELTAYRVDHDRVYLRTSDQQFVIDIFFKDLTKPVLCNIQVKKGVLHFRFYQGCQIFLVIAYQNIPNYQKLYQNAIKETKLTYNIPDFHKIYQIDIKYTKILDFKAFQKISNCYFCYENTLLATLIST
jgi:hypothetical protein